MFRLDHIVGPAAVLSLALCGALPATSLPLGGGEARAAAQDAQAQEAQAQDAPTSGGIELSVKEGTVSGSIVEQPLKAVLEALIEDPAGTQCVVPHLAVAHVGVAGHAHGGAVGAQGGGERVARQPVEVGRARQPHRVRGVVTPDADAIHDAGDHGSGNPGEARVSGELPVHGREL